MKKTYDGQTYKEFIDDFKRYWEINHNKLLQKSNYASAILSDPELFGTITKDIDDWLAESMREYNIIICPAAFISKDDVIVTINKMANPERVKEIMGMAHENTPSLTTVLNTMDVAVSGIFGMQYEEEQIKGYETKLKYNFFMENDYTAINKESYERRFLKSENRDGDLFFTGGALTATKIKVDRSMFKFFNRTDMGYIAFWSTNPGRSPSFSEVYNEATFTGPCKLSFHAIFEAKDDTMFKGISLKPEDRLISEDRTCKIELHVNEITHDMFIMVDYTRLKGKGIHDLQEYFFDCERKVRQLLRECNCTIKW